MAPKPASFQRLSRSEKSTIKSQKTISQCNCTILGLQIAMSNKTLMEIYKTVIDVMDDVNYGFPIKHGCCLGCGFPGSKLCSRMGLDLTSLNVQHHYGIAPLCLHSTSMNTTFY